MIFKAIQVDRNINMNRLTKAKRLKILILSI